MDREDLTRAKRALRREVLRRRDGIPEPERERASAAIHRRVIDAVAAVGGEGLVVMAFWSFGSEVPTGPILEALARRGDTTVLPAIAGGELEPRIYVPGEPLRGTSFGAMEPAAGIVLDPEDLDVVLVPGVAFDRRGMRVGYGGGFYDRLLPRTRRNAARIGVCFGAQLVDSVPAGPADVAVDAIVTEAETIVPAPKPSGRT
jgi:5-formyltetrahydrofolate cyclo-ligase